MHRSGILNSWATETQCAAPNSSLSTCFCFWWMPFERNDTMIYHYIIFLTFTPLVIKNAVIISQHGIHV
jgi:hypothetical protein